MTHINFLANILIQDFFYKISYFYKLFYVLSFSNKSYNSLSQGTLTQGKGSGTVDLLIQIGCFIKKENWVSVWKAPDLNLWVQGGHPYWYFPFSKASLIKSSTRLYGAKFSPILSLNLVLRMLIQALSVFWQREEERDTN